MCSSDLAKRLFKLLEGGEVEITGSFPAGTIGTTSENLAAAAGGEHYETNVMYPEFAKTAREEGFEEIAKIFLAIAVAEKQHEKVFLALKANVDQGSVFKKDKIVVWRCRNCGYIHVGTEAPARCPACNQLLDALYAGALVYHHGHSVGGTNPSLLRAIGAGAAVDAFDVSFNPQ